MMTLRPLEPEDLELLYTIENDADIWWVGCQTAPVSRYHLRQYVAENQADIFKDEQLRLVIDVDGEAVGLVDLFNFQPKHRRAELGMALLKSVRGKGYGTEAFRQIVRYSRDVIGLHQIYTIVPESNTASVRALEKTGFSVSGTLKDWCFNAGEYENCLIMQLFCKNM